MGIWKGNKIYLSNNNGNKCNMWSSWYNQPFFTGTMYIMRDGTRFKIQSITHWMIPEAPWECWLLGHSFGPLTRTKCLEKSWGVINQGFAQVSTWVHQSKPVLMMNKYWNDNELIRFSWSEPVTSGNNECNRHKHMIWPHNDWDLVSKARIIWSAPCILLWQSQTYGKIQWMFIIPWNSSIHSSITCIVLLLNLNLWW